MKKIKFDSLIDEAIEICKDYDIVSTPLLQRKLGTGFIKAATIFDQLRKLKIISRVEETKIDEFGGIMMVGFVDKKKIRELEIN